MVPFIRTAYEDFLPNILFRWNELCQTAQISNEKAQTGFEDLVYHYTHKKRSYHNLSHIQSMFLLFDQAEEHIECKEDVSWAIFFHDLIYRAEKKNNEEKSAQAAQEFLIDSLAPEKLALIGQLILSTKKHEPLSNLHDNALLLDLDLAILSSPLDLYDSYRIAIRNEYSIFPNFLYNPGRKKVLQHFLERDRIYFTDYFYQKHEKAARQNLKWELETLSKS